MPFEKPKVWAAIPIDSGPVLLPVDCSADAPRLTRGEEAWHFHSPRNDG